jgi:hypothetical protein
MGQAADQEFCNADSSQFDFLLSHLGCPAPAGKLVPVHARRGIGPPAWIERDAFGFQSPSGPVHAFVVPRPGRASDCAVVPQDAVSVGEALVFRRGPGDARAARFEPATAAEMSPYVVHSPRATRLAAAMIRSSSPCSSRRRERMTDASAPPGQRGSTTQHPGSSWKPSRRGAKGGGRPRAPDRSPRRNRVRGNPRTPP